MTFNVVGRAVGGIALLLMSPFVQAVPALAAEPITIYLGTSYQTGTEIKLSSEDRGMLARVEQAGEPVDIRMLPARRALQSYLSSEDNCIFFPAPLAEGDVISKTVGRYDFALYHLSSSAVKGVADVRRVGTLDGGQLYFGADELPGVEWVYSVTWDGVVSLLHQGRVDAVGIGKAVTEVRPEAAKGLVRVSDYPTRTLELALHCKPTDRNAAFIAQVNEAISEDAGADALGSGGRP